MKILSTKEIKTVVSKGLGIRRRDEILWHGDRGRQRLYTHEGGEHRWKQSGIRDDVRPGTQEEGQVT